MTNNMTHDPKKPDSVPADIKPAFIYAKTRDWSGYFQAVEGREPRETVIKAIELFDQEPVHEPIQEPVQSPRMAVDLGCGEGRDSAALLRAGWRVHAIDGHPEGLQRLMGRSDLDDPTRLTMQLAPFESVELPSCDLLNASFSLPFCHPDCFDELWGKIVAAIRPGGRFSGQLFGDRDSWASIPDRSHHTKSQVEQLLEPFEIEQMKEDERKGEDCGGTKKDWHVFHIVARKPANG